MVDALGVKGRDNDVYPTLKAAREITKELQSKIGRRVLAEELQVMAFSDTIAIGALPREGSSIAAAVDTVCACLGRMCGRVAQQDPPIVFRGVVTSGGMWMNPDESFMFGPAVDEAAELYELAEGAFVWLAPSAASAHVNELVEKWDVPLKGGSLFRTQVVSPFFGTSAEARNERDRIHEGYEKALCSWNLSVVVKRQNTLRFLDHIDHAGTYDQRILRDRARRGLPSDFRG